MIRILLIFFLFGSLSVCKGQSYQEPKKAEPNELPAQNDIFLEVLGSGGGYSLNYERLILLGPPFSLRGRLGVSFFASRFTFPALLQVSHTLKGPLDLEWGGGVSLIPDLGEARLNKEWTLLAGVRYSNVEGFLFRLSYTPFLRGGDDGLQVEHWGGISAGLLF